MASQSISDAAHINGVVALLERVYALEPSTAPTIRMTLNEAALGEKRLIVQVELTVRGPYQKVLSCIGSAYTVGTVEYGEYDSSHVVLYPRGSSPEGISHWVALRCYDCRITSQSKGIMESVLATAPPSIPQPWTVECYRLSEILLRCAEFFRKAETAQPIQPKVSVLAKPEGITITALARPSYGPLLKDIERYITGSTPLRQLELQTVDAVFHYSLAVPLRVVLPVSKWLLGSDAIVRLGLDEARQPTSDEPLVRSDSE